MHQVIGLDIDGVLGNFNSTYIELLVKLTGKDLFQPKPFEITTWFYPEAAGYTKAEIAAAWKHIEVDENFWVQLQPYPDAQQFLEDLWEVEHQNVYFITHRPGPTAKVQTEFWLRRLLGWDLPTVLVTGAKGSVCKDLGVTHYLDDKTENCLGVQAWAPQTKGYMLARGWNYAIPGVPRIPSLQTFLEEVMRG